ncbi:MAG: FlgD immunoglobulin-like domain containing protein [Candidatus Omnitrophota bacterium]
MKRFRHRLSVILALGCLLLANHAQAAVRIEGNSTSYSSIQQAYDNAQDQDTLQVQSMWYPEDCNFNRDINITLTGGYNQDFTNNSLDDSVLIGDLTITSGEATLGKLIIAAPGGLIDTTPPTGTITINADDVDTSSPEVTLSLSAIDGNSGLGQMQFSNDNITYSASETYNILKDWTLTTGDGEKTVYVKYQDIAGNWSQAFTDTIVLDTTLPISIIDNIADSPDAFSPNGDANYETTTISYQLSTNSNISVNIYDQSHDLIRVLKDDVAESSGTQSAVWDGRNSVGSIVEDGTYTYEITSASETKSGETTVDNKLLNFIEPKDNSIVTIGGQLVFYAIPSRNAANISNVKLYYRLQGTQNWIEPDVDFEQHANGNLLCIIDDIGGNDGEVVEAAIFMQYQDLNGQIRQEYTVPLTLTFSNDFNIFSVRNFPNAFSPNGDGDFDAGTIYFSINRNALISLKIYDINNNLIRTMGENVSASLGDIDVPWDGRNDSLNLQPDGEYIYKITADDGQGNIREKQGSIIIDNHFMTIVEPAQGTALSGQVTFKAVKSDSVFQENNVLFYSRLKGEVEWNAIDDETPSVKQPDGSWTQTIDTSGGLNAETEIRVGADYYSHDNQLRTEYSLPVEYVILNDLRIIESEVSVNPFSPNADGQYDTTQIAYSINAPASVTIKIFDANHNLTRLLQENIDILMGDNLIVWDGRDDSLNPVSEGTYTYEITAEDAQHTMSDTLSGTVVIDNNFMQITSPAVGSNLTEDVTLIAMPSANIQNPQNVLFSYRIQGAQTWTSMTAEQQSNGSWTTAWNVDSLSIGNYEVRVSADYDDLKGEHRSEYSIPNSYIIPDYVKITNVSNSPNAFSPNNDTQFDANTLTYTISRVGTVKVSVYDQNNTLIRTLKDNISEIAGMKTVIWDGRNDTGAIVPDGIYNYLIEVTDQDNYQAQYQKSVAVDNTIITFDPVAGSTISGQTTIKISPSPYVTIQGVSFYYKTMSEVYWNHYIGNGVNQGDGTWDATWDTSNLENGNYEIRASLNYYDADNNFRQQDITPIIYSLSNEINVLNVSDSPDAFSPNNDGTYDTSTISYKLANTDGIITLKLYNSSNNLVRTLKDGVSELQGDYQVAWDGKDNNDQLLADGIYTYIIDVDDGQGNTAQKQGTITIDNHVLSITQPAQGSNINQTVTFTAIPSQLITTMNAVRFYYRLSSEQIWRQIGTAVKQADNSFTIDWDTTLFANQAVEIRAYSYYRDLNNQGRTEYILPLTYTISNNINIFNVADSPDAFSPNNDGNYDTATISYKLVNSDGIVTLKLYDSTNSLVRTLKDGVTELQGDYQVTWDGKNDSYSAVNDGIYVYRITAVDSQGNTAQIEADITVDNHAVTITTPQEGAVVNGDVILRAVISEFCHNVANLSFSLTNTINHSIVTIPATLESDGTWSATWNTADISAGEYTVHLFGTCTDNNERSASLVSAKTKCVVANSHMLSSITDAPDAFSPDGDGISDTATINYILSINSNVTIKIYDVNNALVRTLKENEAQTAELLKKNIVWDGKDDAGNILNDGMYTYIIDADYQGLCSDQEQGTIAIDNQIISLVQPLPDSSISETVTLKLIPSQYLSDLTAITFRTTPGCSGLGTVVKQSDGSWEAVWDTTIDSNGSYSVTAQATFIDLNGKYRNCVKTHIYTVANGLAVSRNAFSPNGDAFYDTTAFYYQMLSVGTVTVKVFDANQSVVRMLKENVPEPAGQKQAVWDGKDDNGAVSNDGTYSYSIDIDYGSGNTTHQEGTVVIDNHFLRITQPIEGDSLSGMVTMTAQPSSYISNAHSVYFFYRKKGDITWHQLYAAFKQQDGTWNLSWDVSALANGEYEVCVSATYNDLNTLARIETSLPIICYIDNPLAVQKVSDAPDAFSPNGDNNYDRATIKYFINSDATVSIRVYDGGDDLVCTIKENEPEIAGEHSAIWDGKDQDSSIVNDGTYTYVIEAVDSQSTVVQQSGESSIDNNSIYITEPVPESTISGQVNMKINFSSFVHRESNVALMTTSLRKNSMCYGVKDSNGNWIVPIDTKIIPNGPIEFYLYVYYYDQNNTSRHESRIFTFTAYNEGADISDLTVTPNPFSPDNSGTWLDMDTGEVFQEPAPGLILDDEAIISFSASDYGVFDIKILDQDGKTIKQLNNSVLYPDPQTQRVEVIWNGSTDGSMLRNGTYRVVVNSGNSDEEIFQDIIVDKIPFIKNTYVSPNPFILQADDYNSARILYTIDQNAFVDIDLYADDVLVTNIQDNVYLESGAHQFIWDGKDTQGQIVDDGSYKIVINAHTELGAQAYPARLPLFICSISDVRISSPTLDPYDSGASMEIYYTIRNDMQITMIVYNDNDEPVRTLVNNELRLAGEKSEVWDGKDDSGQIVPDGFHYFKITSNIDGQEYVQYDPSHTDGADISHFLVVSISDFDPKENIPCILNVDVPEPAYIFVRIRPGRWLQGDSATIRLLKYHEPCEDGHLQFFWDGRDESGAMVPYRSYFIGVWAYRPDVNSVLVIGGTPRITLDANSISPVRFRPYANSYRSSQTMLQTTVSFTISREALVNVGVYNSAGILVASLADEESMGAGKHTLSWDGCSDSGELLPKGDYRVVIQAHHEQNYSDLVQLHIELGF